MVEKTVHSQRIAGRFEIRDPEQDRLGWVSIGDDTSILPNDRLARAPKEEKR